MAGAYPERLLIHRISIQRTVGANYDTRGLDSDVWTNVATNVIVPVTTTIGLDTLNILTAEEQTGDVALFLSDWVSIPAILKTASSNNQSDDYVLRLVFRSTNPTLADINASIGRVSFEIR